VPSASRGIAGSRSHYTNEFCQLCTNPRAAFLGSNILANCKGVQRAELLFFQTWPSTGELQFQTIFVAWHGWHGPEFFGEILDKTPKIMRSYEIPMIFSVKPICYAMKTTGMDSLRVPKDIPNYH
jgi:hypothetical protein